MELYVNEGLRSHPQLLLQEHMDQVGKAALAIHREHENIVFAENLEAKLLLASRFHDVGKGTSAFQEYIDDPEHYKGNRDLKQHTMLSMLIFLAWAKEKGLPSVDVLVLAEAIRGHHSALLPIHDEGAGTATEQTHLLDWERGDKMRLAEKQLSLLHLESLFQQLNWPADERTAVTKLKEHVRRQLVVIKDYYYDEIVEGVLQDLSEEEALRLRLSAQYIYSVLLEADKIYLSLREPEKFLYKEPKLWQPEWIDRRLGEKKAGGMNELRNKIRTDILSNITENAADSIYSLTAPTGVGKTLLAATWALRTRQLMSLRGRRPFKIIIVLPFLSVIEQTAEEYAKILSAGEEEYGSGWLMQSHSLADRSYSGEIEGQDEGFYLDNWRSEIIVTTYDQMLLSLVSPKSRHQMRFHNLCNSLIIMDEVQSLPCKLWYPLDKLLTALAREGNSKVLLMSATLPPFVKQALPLLPDYRGVFKQFGRYQLRFCLEEQKIAAFIEQLRTALQEWLESHKRVLVTLNTRKSARIIRDALALCWPEEYADVPLYFISSDVTPSDRLKIIAKIKEQEPCVVLSTQCVEAGVDFDMDAVWRDFAPLDSMIQIAGRCNREGKKERGEVTIVRLTNEQGRYFSDMIYDEVHLTNTLYLIQNWIDRQKSSVIPEEEILQLTEPYFDALAIGKDTGEQWLQEFIHWRDCQPVHEMLRGKETEEYEFLVLKQDPGLFSEMQKANAVENRWERREAWRKLAGRIAGITVRVRAQRGFYPEWYGEPFNNFYLLHDEYYHTDTGIDIRQEDTGLII